MWLEFMITLNLHPSTDGNGLGTAQLPRREYFQSPPPPVQIRKTVVKKEPPGVKQDSKDQCTGQAIPGSRIGMIPGISLLLGGEK